MKIMQKILILLCFFLFLVSIKKEKSPLVCSLPFSFFQIQSGSMMPEIQQKEIVILWRKEQYQKGDIITYEINNGYYITHRIVQIEKEGYITKGDFNNTNDKEIITIEQIQGKVIYHSKWLAIVYESRFYILTIFLFLWFI